MAIKNHAPIPDRDGACLHKWVHLGLFSVLEMVETAFFEPSAAINGFVWKNSFLQHEASVLFLGHMLVPLRAHTTSTGGRPLVQRKNIKRDLYTAVW